MDSLLTRVSLETGTRYSASIESIRAHSVALGDLQMSDDATTRLDESRLSISRSPPITVDPTASSNLSLLLDQQNAQLNNQQHRIRKTSTLDEEASPLLQQVETARTTSTRYHSIDSSYSTPHHHQQQQQHQQHDPIPVIKGKKHSSWLDWIRQPISYIPAVILGLLLNLLDAISYGNGWCSVLYSACRFSCENHRNDHISTQQSNLCFLWSGWHIHVFRQVNESVFKD